MNILRYLATMPWWMNFVISALAMLILIGILRLRRP